MQAIQKLIEHASNILSYKTNGLATILMVLAAILIVVLLKSKGSIRNIGPYLIGGFMVSAVTLVVLMIIFPPPDELDKVALRRLTTESKAALQLIPADLTTLQKQSSDNIVYATEGSLNLGLVRQGSTNINATASKISQNITVANAKLEELLSQLNR